MDNNFNLFNDIRINFDDYEDVILTDLDKRKMKNRVIKKLKRNKFKNVRKHIVAATLVLTILGSGIFFTNETVRAEIRLAMASIESFFNRQDNSFQNYKTAVLKSVTQKGVTVSVNEVMLDDGQIIASLKIDGSGVDKHKLGVKEKDKLNIIPDSLAVFLDGMELNYGGGEKYKYNKDGSVDILLNREFSKVDLNKTYNIKVTCNQVHTQIIGKDSNVIKGDWNFGFQLSGKSMVESVNIIPINKKITITNEKDNVNIELYELRISPYSIKLIYNQEIPKDRMYGLTLLDESKNELQETHGYSIGNGKLMEEYLINTKSKFINIVPRLYENNKMVLFNDKAVEIAIPLK